MGTKPQRRMTRHKTAQMLMQYDASAAKGLEKLLTAFHAEYVAPLEARVAEAEAWRGLPWWKRLLR